MRLTTQQRHVLARVILADGWVRAASSGERVTLASLWRRGLLDRRTRDGRDSGANAAHEYQAAARVLDALTPRR